MKSDVPAGFLGDIEGIEIITTPLIVRQKSRDFSWFSPILARELENKLADLVVVPKTEDEVMRVASACARHGVPLTVRGGGTGNFGQAGPPPGGGVIDPLNPNKLHPAKTSTADEQHRH